MPNQILYTATKANTSKPIEFWNPATQQYQDSNPLTGIPAGTYSGLKVRLKGSNPEIVAAYADSVTVLGSGGGGSTPPLSGKWITSPPTAKVVVPGAAYDSLYALSTSVINGSKSVTTDAAKAPFVYPDGNRFYSWTYTRDYSMGLAARRDLFTASFMTGWLDNIKSKIQTTGQFAYQVPDHTGLDGTPFFVAHGGSRSIPDNQTYFINLTWEHFQKIGAPTYFTTNRALLDKLLTNGLPLANGVITIPNFGFNEPVYQSWGFFDSQVHTGVPLTANAMYYRALNQMAEMAYSAGDTAGCNAYLAQAKVVQDYLNANLFDANYGLYRTATGIGNGQYDIWGNMWAVEYGVATPAMATQISNKLYDNRANWYQNGGVRQVAIDNEYTPGYACQEGYIAGINAGNSAVGSGRLTHDPTLSVGAMPDGQNMNVYLRYQNGGYWTTPGQAAIITLSVAHPDFAIQMFVEASASLVALNGQEWRSGSLSNVPKYCASMAPLGYVQRDASPSTTNQESRYGLRKRVSTYTGPALRLKRSTDNAQQNIGFTSNGELDVASAMAFLPAGTTGYIVNWFDQTPAARHLTQNYDGYWPYLVFGVGPGGKPALDFKDSQQLYGNVVWGGASPRSMYAVYQNLSTGSFASVIGGQRSSIATPGEWFVMHSRTGSGAFGSPYLVGGGGGTDLTDSYVPDTSIVLGSVHYDGNMAYVRRNGQEVASAAKAYNTGALNGTFTLGNDQNPIDAPNSHFYLYELTVTNFYDDSVIASEESAMKSYYGL
jgi:hypothetical protein